MAKQKTAAWTAQAPDPTWVGSYHDRDGEVELRAGADGLVVIRDEREQRAAEALGLVVTSDAPPSAQSGTEGDQPAITEEG